MKQVKNLTMEVSESAKVATALETKLQRQSDYEQIKKDLGILKSMEFPQEEGGEGGNKRPLEVMILERSKALQSENTGLRVERDKYVEELQEARKNLKVRNSLMRRIREPHPPRLPESRL